ncbi:MAG: hypothetical protein MUC77_18710 [Chromatiaceae bacterium]|jgi:hypothetical protein|nr:hypothetical protein [Chromatiaceae bacterium]
MTLIAHHHIFKNAGTTIDWILERNFPGQVLHVEGTDPGGRLRPRQVRNAAARYPDHRAVSSHSFPLPSRGQAWARVHLSVLRDPIDRYASIYRFERSREIDHPANRAARELGLEAYCQWWLDNPSGIWLDWQTRCCTPQYGAAAAVRRLQTRLRRRWGAPPSGLSGRHASGLEGWDADLDLAVEAALETALVFTVDRFDQGLVLLEALMRDGGTPFDASYVRQNVSRSESEPSEHPDETLSAEVKQRLIEANALDYQLLRRVRARLDRRYAELDPQGTHLTEFRQRCERLDGDPDTLRVCVPDQSDWVLVPA